MLIGYYLGGKLGRCTWGRSGESSLNVPYRSLSWSRGPEDLWGSRCSGIIPSLHPSSFYSLTSFLFYCTRTPGEHEAVTIHSQLCSLRSYFLAWLNCTSSTVRGTSAGPYRIHLRKHLMA